MKKYRALSAVGIAAVSLLLSGCVGSGDPDWKVSMEQFPEVSEMAREIANETEPQFKTDRFSATFVPLGSREVDGNRITRFALSANLPHNCITQGNEIEKSDGSDACVDFMFASRTALLDQEGKSYQAPLHRGNGSVYIETTQGISTFELTTPADADRTSIYLIADGSSVTLNPETGRPHGELLGTPVPSPSPSQEPAAQG